MKTLVEVPNLQAQLIRGELGPNDAARILRHPFCTLEHAKVIASSFEMLRSEAVRELLAATRGFNQARAVELLPTLGWATLLRLAQNPRVPPLIRRQAERRLISRLNGFARGEMVALARLAHQPIFATLIAKADSMVLEAMLDNPRMTSISVAQLIRSERVPVEVLLAAARHRKWGNVKEVRLALIESHRTPLPIALGILPLMTSFHLVAISKDPRVGARVAAAAAQLAVVRSSRLRQGRAKAKAGLPMDAERTMTAHSRHPGESAPPTASSS